MFLGDELQELAFAHDCIGKVQSSEFHLAGVEDSQGAAEPIVQRSMVFEFQGADRVCDAFDGIGLSVCPVVHRIDTPTVIGPVVVSEHDSV